MLRHERLCTQLEDQFGGELANHFGPVRLKAFRAYLIRDGHSGKKTLARKNVNQLLTAAAALDKGFDMSAADASLSIASTAQTVGIAIFMAVTCCRGLVLQTVVGTLG